MARSRLGTSQFSTFGGWAKGLGPALLAAILVATTFFAASVLATTLLVWEGEDMIFSSTEVSIVKRDPEKWSGGAGLKYTGVAAPYYSVSNLSEVGDYSMTIRGKAKTAPSAPDAWPIVEVYRNSIQDPANKIATLTINETTLTDYTVSGTIPQGTTKILVKATGNMAGDQIFWLDKVSLKHTPPPDTTPPQTTIDSGPSSASTTYNGDPSFSFSSEPNSTFECKLDSGSWDPCTSPKSYSGLANGEHTFSVRAIDLAGNVDASPETRQWRVWGCSGKHIVPGDDLDAIVNADSSTVATTFCIHGGTYAIDRTINLRTGDKLLGEEGATTTRGPATYPVNPMADIVNGASLTRLIHMQGGNSEISWIEASGAIATDSNGLAATGGTPNTGTGDAINGTNGDTRDEIHHVYLHDNGSNGVSSPRGRIYYSHFERNTLNPDFLGHAGAAVKSVYEFEAAYNFIEHEQGNGLWADHGLRNQVLQPHGFWAHDNVIVNNDRFGIRYEYSPFLAEGVHQTVLDLTVGSDTLPTALVEDNYLAANARGGGAQEAAQNGLWRENIFGGFTLAGVTYGHNGAKTGLAEGLPRAAQASNSDKTTDLWNAQFRNNVLHGEAIAGCSQPDEVVLCEGNVHK